MFGGSKGFAGLGASRPLDPASEIQRLLNQHTAHALALGELGLAGALQWPPGPAAFPWQCAAPSCRASTAGLPHEHTASFPPLHRHSFPLSAEKDIKEMMGKREAAARKHAAALEEREKTREAFVAAERAAAEAEAEAMHRRAEAQAGQVGRAVRLFAQ